MRTKLNRCKLAFMRTAGALYLGDRVWAFRFTDLDGKRAQMEFARVGDSADGDVLTLRSARNKVREYKVVLTRDGVDPRGKKRGHHTARQDVQGMCRGPRRCCPSCRGRHPHCRAVPGHSADGEGRTRLRSNDADGSSRAIIPLASDAASFVTAQIVTADRGKTAGWRDGSRSQSMPRTAVPSICVIS
jgi:hypothetical protein